MSAINTVISFYQLLNKPELTALLGNGKIWRYQRPLNSDNVDVVISVPEYVGGSFNVTDVEINVFSPNIQNFNPLGFPDNTHPDVTKLRSITNKVLELLGGHTIKVAGKLIQTQAGDWYSNIVVELSEVNTDLGTEATLWESSATADGYGGATATFTQVWSGLAAMDNARKDDQLDLIAGRYEMPFRVDWLLPDNGSIVIPQKNMELRTDEGEYVIRSIIPEESMGLWRIITVRKDAVRA